MTRFEWLQSLRREPDNADLRLVASDWFEENGYSQEAATLRKGYVPKVVFSDLVGQTLTKIDPKDVTSSRYKDEMIFTTASGVVFKLYHSQD